MSKYDFHLIVTTLDGVHIDETKFIDELEPIAFAILSKHYSIDQSYTSPDKNVTLTINQPDLKDYNAKCLKCGAPAMQLFNSIDCSRGCK